MEQKEKSQLKVLTQKLRGLQNEALAQANHAEQHFFAHILAGMKVQLLNWHKQRTDLLGRKKKPKTQDN